MTGECVTPGLYEPVKAFKLRDYERVQERTDLPFNLLDVVLYAELVTFRVRSNGTIRVPPHRDLVRLHQSYLTILVKNTEGVSLGFENDTDSLQAVHHQSDKYMRRCR
jgi:hypothetical protein